MPFFKDAAQANQFGQDQFPGHIGVTFDVIEPGKVTAHLEVRQELLAPNGFLHAATVVGLADTACGYGCIQSLPEGASGFTTVELKSNFLGTALKGEIIAHATAQHMGRTTQLWDAEVRNAETDKIIALFRCTQMVLYPKT